MQRRREKLNGYAHELHAARGKRKLSAFRVHGCLAKLAALPDLSVELPFDPLDISSAEIEKCCEALGALSRIPEVADKPTSHPWYGADFDPKKFSERERSRLLGAIKTLVERIPKIAEIAGPISGSFGLPTPIAIEQAEKLFKLCRQLEKPPRLAGGWLSANKKERARLLGLLGDAEQHAASLKKHLADLGREFKESLLAEPIGEMSKRFSGEHTSASRMVHLSYWKDWWTVRKHWHGAGWLSFRRAAEGVSFAKVVNVERKWLDTHRGELATAFESLFSGEETDWSTIRGSLDWLADFVELTGQPILPTKLGAILESTEAGAQPKSERLEQLLEEIQKAISIVAPIFPSKALESDPVSALAPWLAAKQSPSDLDNWSEYLAAIRICNSVKLAECVRELEAKGVPASQFRDAFMKVYWKAWIAKVYESTPTLGNFRPRTHQEVLDEFKSLDRQLKTITANMVQEAIEGKQPKGAAGISDEGQVAILRKEMQKKKRLKPLRRLFSEIPHLLQELKPCLLMSPLSVASFLGASPYSFDLVIFDEASQIPPADAIGAVLRGKVVIVVGDDKQLPPTRFFQADVDIDEELDEGPVEEPLESILDECAALPGFLRAQLRWHYRSKSEELIAFSNSHFYEGRLITFPGPAVAGSSGAVRFLHVPDGVYDRGKSRTNRREAGLVAKLVEEHFLKYGTSSSLGVITLNLAQEEAIWAEWERRKSQNPQLNAFDDPNSNEPLFIKALEKVQGDERDVILLSIGYGPDPTGAVALNFGPINQSGGERRLNVAVTRARQQMTVVTSLLPNQLDLARLNRGHLGVATLQQYLEYARNGGKFSAEAKGTGPTDSDFEDCVRAALSARGLKIDTQVGCSGFKIDLAVRNPNVDTEYILGIECDGATYHSFRTARDRDRLRQEVLEALGWKIHRIWSTDWFKNHSRIVDEIVERVKELGHKEGRGVPRRPEPKSKEASGRSAPPTPQPISIPEPHSTQRELPVFREYEFGRLRSKEDFYAAADGGQELDDLLELIRAIAEKEGPIHLNVLAQRVATGYRMGRVGEKIEQIVKSAIREGASQKLITLKYDFVWHGAYDPDALVPRRPHAGGTPRPAEFVALEELAGAAIWILKRDHGVPRDALVTSVARIMGYDRTGHKVEERISKALDRLLGDGRIIEYSDQLTLKPE